MPCCNGFPCCGITPTAAKCCSGKSLYCTVMSDTFGVLWRVGGTVDPWTKSNLQKCEAASLTKAGMCANAAATQAKADVSTTLKANHACPCCCFWCSLFASWKKFFCFSENFGMIIIVLAFVAGLVYLVYASRHR